MKTIRSLVLTLLVGCALLSASAQAEYIFPSVSFDAAVAAARLQPGTGTIKGVAIAKERDSKKIQIANLSESHRAWQGTQVTLFPVTPYLEEFLELRKKHGSKAALSNEAFSHRMLTWTDDDGAFEFTDLKPGQYYLEATVQFVMKTATDVQTGTAVTAIAGGGPVISSTPIYTTVYGSHGTARFVTGLVEITADGATAKVTLKN
jgi:hypothetical protein